jgi:hypothetical protein
MPPQLRSSSLALRGHIPCHGRLHCDIQVCSFCFGVSETPLRHPPLPDNAVSRQRGSASLARAVRRAATARRLFPAFPRHAPPRSNELVGCLEDLREKREDLHRSLLRDEEEKVRGRNVNRRSAALHATLPPPPCYAAALACPVILDRSPRRPQARIQKELTALTERLGQLNNDLAKKINT